MISPFVDKLANAVERNSSLLCVGLDPDPALMPIEDVAAFNRAIIEATSDLVCAYKPNLAFYEALGESGWAALRATLAAIPPGLVVIADAKRGDIGNTADAYARAILDNLGADALTVNAWGGRDSIEPFVKRSDKGVFIWCRSSNPGAGDLQDLLVQEDGARPLWQALAMRAQEWNTSGNIGLVMGATYPEQLGQARALCPDLPILVPGVGAQQGDLEASVRAGLDREGRGILVAVSRQVIFASKGADFAAAARATAQRLRDEINRYRTALATS